MNLFFVFLLVIISLIVALGVIFLTYWPMYGAPYVPTQNKEIADIFAKIKLKKGQVFCDLGCGDGRMVFEAVKITQTKAIGVDINWGLIQWCKLFNKKRADFYCQNIFKKELPIADIYFVYLWPKVVERLAAKFETEKIKNITVVSKSFQIHQWQKYLKSSFILNQRRFWVYRI